jgi:hypothetical protein
LQKHPEIFSHRIKELQKLEQALEDQKEAFLGLQDPELGQRKGAEWHKAAHLIARYVESTLWAANPEKYEGKRISRAKHGAFVLVVRDALVLAGQKERTADAIAAVLTRTSN